MTTVTVSNLVPPKQAENSQTTQYTSTDVKTIIDKFVAVNNSGSTATITINLVPSGDSVGDANKIASKTLLSGERYTFPEIVGNVLEADGVVSTIASAASAITITASGRVIS